MPTNVFSDGTDRIHTSTLYFRTETELIEAPGSAGFEDIELKGTWKADPVAAEHRLLIVRSTTDSSPTPATQPASEG